MKQKKQVNICKQMIFPSIGRQTYYNISPKQHFPNNNTPFAPTLGNLQDQTLNHDFKKKLNESMKNLQNLLGSQMPKSYQERYNSKKLKPIGLQKLQQMRIQEAEAVILSSSKSTKEKASASRVVVQNLFNKVYSGNLHLEDQKSIIKQKLINKSILDVGILQQILTEIQHNPKSHSITIRKSQLSNLKSDLSKMKQQRQKKDESYHSLKEEKRIQTIYKLKNQYASLKSYIIPSKCEEYQVLKAQNSNKENYTSTGSSNFKHTFLLTGLDKQNKVVTNFRPSVYKSIEYFQQFKAFRNSCLAANHRGSRFQKSQDKLIIENISQISPNTFLYLISQCRFDLLKVIKIRFLKASDDLLFLFVDCMKLLGKRGNVIDLFQLTSVSLQSSLLFMQTQKSLAKSQLLCFKLYQSKRSNLKAWNQLPNSSQKQETVYRRLKHNRIDILGVRLMENLCEDIPTLHLIDARNNQIPHYANLKDKKPIIQFF